jgi:cation-transporting ATPase E
LAASATAGNRTSAAIAGRWQAARRPLSGEVPFASSRKWSATAFAGGEPPGIVALGAAPFLHDFLTRDADGFAVGWAEVERVTAAWTERGLRVLLVATHQDATALPTFDDEDLATLPSGMRPLGLVAMRDELRSEAAQTLKRFIDAGVSVKIISGDDPETVVALARQAGLTGELPWISGRDLDALDDEPFGRMALETTVFGRITPRQKERLVDALRARGKSVAMIGDGFNDLLSLKKANLAIAMGSGSQATRGVADLVLMQDSFAAVAQAVEEGQRILNGMQDILKLFLTRIATVGLVVVSSLVVVTFPIELRNASALTIFTVGIPSALLALWAQPGKRTRDSLARTLASFVIPAAVVSSLIGLAVFYGSLALAGAPNPAGIDAATSQARTAFTTFLVLCGLMLIVFVEPPTDWFAVAEPKTTDRRPTYLAIGLALAYAAVLAIPPARDFFSFTVPGPGEAALAIGAVLVWIPLVRLFWKRRFVERFLGLG